MTYKYLFETVIGQDGAIYNDYLFRFNSKGDCKVFSMRDDHPMLSEFTLDKAELIMPHSNAVCFGTEYYEETDEFPLLYTNLYNTYFKSEDRLEGVCCVYRLLREGVTFTTSLVQVIKIGFVEDLGLWKSLEENGDVRSYGNFIVDTDRNQYCGFTMRDKEQTTRYFTFTLPKLSDGSFDETLGVKVLTLQKEDILTWFDCQYSRYIQGACYYKGKIYSVEGFSGSETNKPKLQIIDLISQKQVETVDLCDLGLVIEPEFIEAYQDQIYYSDASGRIYLFTF